MRRIRKPEYWQFIVLVAHKDFWGLDDSSLENKHAAFAYCTKCKRSIRFKIKNSGIEPHMRKYHEEDLKNFGKDDNTTANRIGRSLEPEFANVDSVAKTHMLRNVSPEQQNEVYKLLAQWISSHFRPLLMIEDEGFIKFVKFITEEICGVKLHLPGRTRLRADIITLAGDLRVEVKADIARSCFEFVSWTLEVKEIPGKHDGAAIAAALNMILDD
ncbi:hypothetical protein PHMEG_00031402 [Phytophthora megakarya]|uniref:BED-type domain-containing protein n=1 Tax=Phytophthora megakarya TaxID=4795 RepID=A0A225V0J2_9STRA|nr:hypothetical protein PHMEG_00031402 [Phytophthora megakarya]